MPDTLATSSPLRISWFLGIIGFFLIFVVIAFYSSRMARDTSDYDQQRAAVRYDTLAKLRAADHEALTTAAWIDQAKGVVRIPIDEAMGEEIDTLKAQPVQAGAAIPGTTPKPAPSAATPAPAPNTTAQTTTQPKPKE
jgi:hypothetical protein